MNDLKILPVILLLVFNCMNTQSIGQSLSQRGKDFWLVKPRSITDTRVVLDLSAAQEAATVTVRAVSGSTVWERTYQVPANASVVTEVIPDFVTVGDAGSRDVLYNRYVYIHSTAPIACYAHFYGASYSGGTMLLSEETWGYSYSGVNSPDDNNSYVYVIASQDNTKVEVTPVTNTTTGHAPGVPFTMTLNKGQVYPIESAATRAELTGTVVKSVANGSGQCLPFAVFSGSIGTPICGATSDFIIQQVPPEQTWGKSYVTAPFSSSVSPSRYNNVIYRVMVKDPATVVRRNGSLMAGLINQLYYEFTSNEGEFIEADQPVMVVQFMTSQSCNTYGESDPEMVILSPIEQAVKRVDFHNSYMLAILHNYLTIVVPTSGANSVKVNGSASFDHSYVHPRKADYTVLVKHWIASDLAVTVESDVPFTAVTYGLGSYESYAFNLVPLQSLTGMIKLQEKGQTPLVETVCQGELFQLALKTEYEPTKIEWHFNGADGISHNDQDLVLNNPIADRTLAENGRLYHIYLVPRYDSFRVDGIRSMKVTVTTPVIGNCSNTQTFTGYFESRHRPVADFDYSFEGCAPFEVAFRKKATRDTSTITGWLWSSEGHDVTSATASYTYASTDGHEMYFKVNSANGCYADTTRVLKLIEAAKPVVDFTMPQDICMPDGAAKFINQSNYSGTSGVVAYRWSFGDGNVSTERDAVHSYAAAGSYPVKLVAVAADGCSDSISKVLSSFLQRPSGGFRLSEKEICSGEEVRFTDVSSANGGRITGWHWLLGNGDVSMQANPVKKFTIAGNYDIIQQVTSGNGCASKEVVMPLVVYAKPEIDAGADKTILEGASVQLTGVVLPVTGVAIQWAPAAYLSNTTVATPYAAPPVSQRYYLTAVSGICEAHDSVYITVLSAITVPNAFSPNGDGQNDIWLIPGLNSYPASILQVFNRFGQKVFESRGYTRPWDGTYQGKPLAAGTYYYVIVPGEGRAKQTGAVTILR